MAAERTAEQMARFQRPRYNARELGGTPTRPHEGERNRFSPNRLTAYPVV
jgi:hypothetical protein